jgi:aspartate aminotransferase
MVEQIAVLPLLENSKKYTKKIVAEYKKRRDVVFETLSGISGIVCQKPKGAFYITVKLPIKNSEHFAKWLLTDFSFKGKTVMVAPAKGFYATMGLGKDEVRIAFVLSAPKLREAMKVFEEGLKRYKGKIEN